MDQVKIIELKETILRDNDADAEKLRGTLGEKKTFYINVMSSPGAGKTSVLLAAIPKLQDEFRIGVMEADTDSDVDAKAVAAHGIRSVQLHTGGMCHLDADMSRQGLREIGSDDLDIVFLENVGNLVCPAEFDTGSHENIVILSVPEGDDKPLKYPLMFTKCGLVLINKIDAMPAFDFDLERAKTFIAERNPDAVVIPVSARTGEGIDEFCAWIRKKAGAWR